MKRINYVTFILVLGIMLNSCATVYKCGEPKPAKNPALWSNRLKTVVNERDLLCSDLASEKKENERLNSSLDEMTGLKTDLEKKFNELTGSNKVLQERYQNLINENLSETDKLSKALIAKSEELDMKEKLLREREASLDEMRDIIARQDSITRRLNSILRNSLLGFNSDELSVEIKNGKVYVSMSDKLLFRSGSVTVEEKGKEALKLLGDVLGKNPDIDILVEGHTDNVPIKTSVFKDNWDLSVVRATTIVRILSGEYQIAPTRLTASGRGEYFPKSDNDSQDGRARNRRTEIILSPKLDEIMQILVN
jgi:chemotaxis protein MotB